MKPFISAFVLLLAVPLWAGDPIISFEESDPEMSAAIAQARTGLDKFLDHAASHPEGTSIKVAIPTVRQKGMEHIWVTPFMAVDDGFVGYLGNEPNDLGDLKHGSQISFTREQVSDWGAEIDGRTYGYYTLRVILPQLSKDQAEGLRSWLSDDPLPSAWR